MKAGKRASAIEPEWLQNFEKEQADKLGALRIQVQAKRDYVFGESMYGSPEHQNGMQAMTNSYDVVLRLIKELMK